MPTTLYLRQNKRETVKSIADHIQVPYTDQLLDEIVDATEFDTMKKAKQSTEEELRKAYGNKASYFRKGKYCCGRHNPTCVVPVLATEGLLFRFFCQHIVIGSQNI